MADNTTGREAAGQVQVAEEILNSFLSLAPKKDFDLVKEALIKAGKSQANRRR